LLLESIPGSLGVDEDCSAVEAMLSQAATIDIAALRFADGRTALPADGADVHAGDEIALDVETDRTRLLVSSEVKYPGWITTIDQKEVPTVLVNTAFRGVVVPSGRHRVVFEYVPWSFMAGCVVSLIGCLMLVLSMRKCRRQHGPAMVENAHPASDGSGG